MPLITRKTVSDTYLTRVKATPLAVGFQFKPRNEVIGPLGVWKKVTFGAFDQECRLLSYGLMGLGIEPQDHIAILSTTRYEWALADIAILGAKAVTIPVYASNIADDIVFILNHSEAKLVFLEDARQFEKIIDRQNDLPHLKHIVLFEPGAMNLAMGRKDVLTLQALKELGRREQVKKPNQFEDNLTSAAPTDLITICYTSGTTGTPKGAMISHENMMSVLDDCVTVFKKQIQSETERLVAFLPASHIIGKVELLATFVFGWQECYAENFDRLIDNMMEIKPTIMFAVPRIFEKAHQTILANVRSGSRLEKEAFQWALRSGKEYFEPIWNDQKPKLIATTQYQAAKRTIFKKILSRFGGKLRFTICGGAPLPKDVGQIFQIIGLPILEGYGLTETSAPVTLNTLEHYKLGSVGRPLPEVSIKIADDGEILVKSKKVFCGYYKLPAETRDSFSSQWFHTGDIGYLDQDGFLFITDRKKDLIVTSGGKNIAPQKIENLAKNFPYIHQIVVHGDQRNFLTALVTLDRDRVIQYAQENNILFSEYSELIKNPKIKYLIQKDIDGLNSELASFETIKRFIILPRDFSIESGELTPSLKVKRGAINLKYKPELDSLYSAGNGTGS